MIKAVNANGDYSVAPFTGAWIEILVLAADALDAAASHPSRVRGLKSADAEIRR